MMAQQLGQIIKSIRTTASLSLKSMSQILDIDISLLSRIERQERLPTPQQLEKICEHFPTHDRELKIHWLSAKILTDISTYEELALEAMQVAEDTIKYNQKENA